MSILVTGGTRGIGREICRILPNARGIGSAECDLASLRDIDAYVPPRNVQTLVLCAGVMGITHFLEDQKTEDGFDRCWQINFLSQARLLLRMPWVKHVVYVSSAAAHGVRARDLTSRFACHSRLLSYAASKAQDASCSPTYSAAFCSLRRCAPWIATTRSPRGCSTWGCAPENPHQQEHGVIASVEERAIALPHMFQRSFGDQVHSHAGAV